MFSPANGTHMDLMPVERTMNDSINRLKAALNPRAHQGERAWAEAYMVSNRLRLAIGVTVSALTSSDDPLLIQALCDLLQREVLQIREIRAEITSAAPGGRPWLQVYRDVVDNILNLVQSLSQYEI
ncbi:hypothetical protein KIN20_008605 [Parelaphostrongylus tenuis]|uniref:Uncharacterized protein n=1 Tax=Parelaphostrongylus tenuis TaxID=148309 RepID=A0AAD5QKQ0_PARTN|nr:hypothetical protein KIN20_008605 [Parelaphostrongylus tenuis]